MTHTIGDLPLGLEHIDRVEREVGSRRIAVFLDYDGTLTPIVSRPELATLSDRMRASVRGLARSCPVAIISGRDLQDVKKLVGLQEVYYAGSHGFEIEGPAVHPIWYEHGTAFQEDLQETESELHRRLADVEGAVVEHKRFSISVHYRNVPSDQVGFLIAAVKEVAAQHGRLRVSNGKKVYDFQPDVEWHKGRAVLWLLDAIHENPRDVCAVYVGDDVTDEDAFKVLKQHGIGFVVHNGQRNTWARYGVRSCAEVGQLLEQLRSIVERGGQGPWVAGKGG